MAGSATVGVLKVLMSADSAQITQDLGKARRAVKDAQADFALFGRAGKDAKTVLVDIGSASTRELGRARQATVLLTREFGWLGGHVSKVGSLIGDLAAGNLAGFGAATVAAATAVTIAISRITEAWESVKKAQEEATKGAAERLKAARVAGAERFDTLQGSNLASLTAADANLDQALRARARAQQALKDAVIFTSEEHIALFRANEAVEQAMFERTAAYNKAALSQEVAARKFRESLREITESRETETAFAGLSENARRAEMAILALGKTLRGDLQGIGLTEETAAKALQQKGADAGVIAEQVRLRKDLEEALARVLGEQSEHLRRQARLEDARPFKERLAAARESLRLLHQGIDPQSKEAKLQREIAEYEDKRRTAQGIERVRLGLRLANAQQVLDLERAIAAVLEDQARARKAAEAAASLRQENDLAAIAAGPGTDRQKELARLADERREALEGLKEGSKEYLDLVREFRRKEAEVNRQADEAALQSRMELLDRVTEVRRQAAAATLADDRSRTRLELDAEDARHDALLRSINEAQVKGLLTEEVAGQRRAAATAAHIDLRLAIQREGRDRELAWEAGYRQRLLSLEMEGQTDEATLARLGTEQRVATLQEETRRLVEELRRRGEMTRAEEVANASREAEARIRREGQLRATVAGGDFGEGFQARMSQMRTELGGLGRVGAATAETLVRGFSDGVAGAIEEVVRGSKSAKEAFRDWARELLFDLARVIEQALLMRAVLSIFPGLAAPAAGAGGAAPAVPASAHGGTYRVAGYGGLDSKLVALRVSPGELVRVSQGANASAGGGGDLYASVVVRNHILADDMARKTSREAKAEIVGTALHRGSRRGARAPE
ncbi:MAG: hypothetical protein HUU06_00300 [Planctomycetaceae bacterium]|nr:hypothetical protein [Planctomycetota bacterium]NUN51216.1 hypothetical protein [Planctomycetaceae bacterium]